MDATGNRKREENEKRQRIFAQLAVAEERVIAGAATGGSSRDATQALIDASLLLNSEFVLSDIKSAHRELDFVETALEKCSDGVGGVISIKDVFNAFDRAYREFKGTVEPQTKELEKFCLTQANNFKSCPPWHNIRIAIESLQPKNPEQTQLDGTQTQKAKRKSSAVLREEAAAEREANARAEEANDAERAAAEERDLETITELNRCFNRIRSAISENGGGPIDYWKFVYDPSSKGKTFMNMLHVNHILSSKERAVILIGQEAQESYCLWFSKSLTDATPIAPIIESVVLNLTDQQFDWLKQRYGR